MSVPYEPIVDDLMQNDDTSYEHPEIFFMHVANRRDRKWPRSIGVVQIIVGFLLAVLGTIEVFIIPMVDDYAYGIVQFNHRTCYGAGMFAGMIMVLTGSTAVRASMSKRKTTVFRFYILTLLTLAIYAVLVVLLVVSYSDGWTADLSNNQLRVIHMFVTIFTVLGLMFAVTALVYYYDVVCFGEMQMWQWCLSLLCCSNKAQDRFSVPTDRCRDSPEALLI